MSDHRRRLLPPMGALASFVAAARHDSFSRAGDEIGLTQSAVSRQVAVLEAWLQLNLFERHGRRVQLSPDGQAYLRTIGPALDSIRVATATALSRRPERELTIATLPSFGMRWLAPRLPRLNALHPDLIVDFATRSVAFDFSDERFDAAIHFGVRDWPDVTYDLLFREEALPVCSPERLSASPITTPDDVLAWPLLVQSSRRDAWTQWAKVAGAASTPPGPSGSFEHFMMLAQAAAAGAGIALMPRFLIEAELASGALVCPLNIPLESDNAYFLVAPTVRTIRPSLEQFRTWLLDEARHADSAVSTGP